MRREGPTLAQLRLLVAVAESGGFSEAALNLDLSQSTVSHGIAALERTLGVRLLRRTRYGASLTPLGERVLNHARIALHAVDDAQLEVQCEREPLRGRLRVSCIRSASMHLLPYVLSAMRKQLPHVHIDVVDDEYAVANGHADVGILTAHHDASLLMWPLVHDEYVVLVPADSALPPQLTWAHLTNEPLILNDLRQPCSSVLRDFLDRQPVPIVPAYTAEEDAIVMSMVAHGLGVAVMPRLAAVPLPPGVRMVAMPEPLARTIAIGVEPRRASAPLIRRFVDIARSAVLELTSTGNNGASAREVGRDERFGV